MMEVEWARSWHLVLIIGVMVQYSNRYAGSTTKSVVNVEPNGSTYIVPLVLCTTK